MRTIQALEDKLSEPAQSLVDDIADLQGDLIILGVGGKMGPSLAKLARNAVKLAGVNKKVYGVSRFSSSEVRRDLDDHGIVTIAADLLDDKQLQQLPDVENVIFMAGNKFGTTGKEYFTWAMNTYLPGRVAEKYRDACIVAFSSGNIYPLSPVHQGGATEEFTPKPIGEYAQSCLGRERVFEYFSRQYDIPMVHFRLNYAIDLRYGVLLEIAQAIKEGRAIDLSMGNVNVIWQGDANAVAIRALSICESPPRVLNVTGPETVSIRWLAECFAEQFGIKPIFANEEQETAFLSNASRSHGIFGYPRVTLQQMIQWVGDWVLNNGTSLNKPTHFQEREGTF